MQRILIFAAAVLAIPAASGQQSTARFDAAAAFGARESVEQASLSPDGSKLAYVGPSGGQGSAIFVVKLGDNAAAKPILRSNGQPDRIDGCRWTSDTRLLCTVYGVSRFDTDIVYSSRTIAVDADGSNLKILQQRRGAGRAVETVLGDGSVVDYNAGEPGHVLMIRSQVQEAQAGSMLAQKGGTTLDDVDTMTMRAKIVEQPRRDVSEYITDGRGNVRIQGRTAYDGDGFMTGVVRYFYRKKDDRNWLPMSSVDDQAAQFNPYGVDPERDVAYGFKKLDGRMAAYSYALDGSGAETLLYADPNFDVGGFIYVGRSNRIIGVMSEGGRQYFDPALKKLMTSLGQALKGGIISIVDSSEDLKRMLIWAGSDTDPGRYFLFDRTAGTLNELMLTRPQLEKVPLAPMKSISYRAGDGTMVPGYLTLPPGSAGKNIPAIVLPHGGPEARDHWGFDWLVQFFANQGFAVLQPNFRGSTGYGDAWFKRNGFQDWKIAIGDVTDAGRYLVREGIADPSKLSIFGWSYGGYAALQSAVVDPTLFKRVVAVAPLTDMERWKKERTGWSDYPLVVKRVGSGPHVIEGSPAQQAARIQVPVLMFHGDLDRNVSVDQSKFMDSRLKAAGKASELVIYPGLDHYLEDSEARAQMLRRSAAFLTVK
ncbi:alpha/beta fold hydrolase [Sphingomonas sp.]|uniref:alpha/beta hydrolase family protein n=1 Tax=Sphingomonas sp. TaxID=28214 RepID=UPI001EC1F596|nr:alpha/beta fold hydrolase [Sphingomonas sp.]MBX3593504.1 S9 family peptidase [Sphingomonas sp.]